MTKTTKTLLAISLAGFALGCTNVLGGIGLPVGAIFLGWFMVFKMLEKEMALFDKEERMRLAFAESKREPVSSDFRDLRPASSFGG